MTPGHGPDGAPGLSSVHIPPRSAWAGVLRPRIVTWKGGSSFRLRHGAGTGQVVGGARGVVAGFSRQSRSRLLEWLATVDMPSAGLPVFVTLTFPGSWDAASAAWSPRGSKALLEIFRKRMARQWPGSWCLWRLEPQKRGAPHFHLLVWGAAISREWLSRAWWEVVGSGEVSHLKAGTNLQRVRSTNGAVWYCAKYLAKVQQVLPGWDNVGRWWGIQGRANVPRERQVWECSDSDWCRLRRVVVRKRVGPGAGAPAGIPRGEWPSRIGARCFVDSSTVEKLLSYGHAHRVSISEPSRSPQIGPNHLPCPERGRSVRFQPDSAPRGRLACDVLAARRGIRRGTNSRRCEAAAVGGVC